MTDRYRADRIGTPYRSRARLRGPVLGTLPPVGGRAYRSARVAGSTEALHVADRYAADLPPGSRR